MNVKRYIAPTARECLRKVKEELGPDAIVVSNKPVAGGVEIMAMTADGFEALSRQATPLAAGNAAWFHSRGSLVKLDRVAKFQTLLSACIWVAVVACGRWIAYL